MKTIVDYAQLVKQQHALNISLAPVEADPTASSKAYAIGQHFILDGELYKAKTAIALGDALVLDTNYEAAGSIEAQIETLDAENQTLTNNVQARAELSAYNLLNIFNSEINTNGTYTEVINDDGTVTIGGTPTSACTIPYKATAKYNGSVYNLKPNKDYVLDSGLSAISPLNLQVFVKENSDSSWAKIAETTTNTKLLFTTPASFYDIWVRILVPANAVVTASTIVKPMIILSSDVTIGYVPYAMTNKELTDKISNLGIKTKLITIQSTEASDSYNPVTIADELVVTNAAEIVYVYVASNGNVTNKNRYCPVGYALYEIRHVADVVTINVVAYLSSDSNSIYTIGRTRNGSWGTWFKTTMTAIS